MLQMSEGTLFAIICISFLGGFLVVYFMARKGQLEMFQKFSNPTRHVIQSSNKSRLDTIIKESADLSLNEKLVVIQSYFGRPVRVQIGLDLAGSWIEAVTPFSPLDDSDYSFHFDKTLGKDRSVG